MSQRDLRADYTTIAGSYDAGRRLPAESIEQWVRLIRARGKLEPESACLDLGCGTGRFTIPLGRTSGVYAIGADLSAEMLAEAVAKPGAGDVGWLRCDAERLALRDGAFQCVFMSLLLHHVADMNRVLSECWRVLKPGGVCVIRTAAHEQMDTMPMYRFFPTAQEIDRNRLPAIGVIENGLRSVGFRCVSHEAVVQELVDSVEAYIEKVRNKNISALTLLSDEEFAKGLAGLETYFRSRDPDSSLTEVRTEEMTVVIAEK